MDTIFMNSENSKTSEPHVLALKLANKLDLRIGQKIIALSDNKFKISVSTWNKKFELPDGSYSVSDIQDYFDYILKKHGKITDKPSHRYM